MKVEEKHSFNEALDLDEAVWKVMPKIQARKARQLLGVEGNTLQDLARCFEMKFAAEDYEYEIRWPSEHEVEIIVHQCPWYDVITRTGREAIAKNIADTICVNEYLGWTKEFSEEIGFALEKRICSGDGKCLIRFTEEK
jgi:predicted ArsR family transcriptional regulator